MLPSYKWWCDDGSFKSKQPRIGGRASRMMWGMQKECFEEGKKESNERQWGGRSKKEDEFVGEDGEEISLHGYTILGDQRYFSISF